MSYDDCDDMRYEGMCSVQATPGEGEPFFEAVEAFAEGANPSQLNYGVAVTDWDGDGIFEAVVAGFEAPNRVIKFTGGEYVDLLQGANHGGRDVADAGRKAIGVAACDVDGDGAEELYVLNTDAYSGSTQTSDRLFYRDGSGWQDAFSLEQNPGNFVAGRSCACVDRFGRGEYGVMVANYGGPMRLYEAKRDARGGGLLVDDKAEDAGVARTIGGRALASARLLANNDAAGMDIFANNELYRSRTDLASNYLFSRNGDGTYTDVADTAGVLDKDNNGRGVAVFDANDDGLLDIAAGNWVGRHRLWVQRADGTFEDEATPEMAIPSRIRTVIAADFDNSGSASLFFNNIPGDNRLFGRNGAGEWIKLNIGDALEPQGLGTGAAVGDFDDDGVLELLVSHGESGEQPLTMYKARGAAGRHWLRVAPVTAGGAPARGATVSLRVPDGKTTTYAIDAGSGYLCQMEPVGTGVYIHALRTLS